MGKESKIHDIQLNTYNFVKKIVKIGPGDAKIIDWSPIKKKKFLQACWVG